jgi:hypothetical protein
MSRKHFSWLLGATILLGMVVFLLPGRTSKDSEMATQALLPGLAERINQVEQVEVVRGGNETQATLQRRDNGWVVAEFGNYAADWPQLRELLASLARAEIVEPKTANPDYFSRLGVSDVSNADSKATLLRLKGGGDDVAILVGNTAEGRDGQYVRLLDGERALLIDQSLKVPAEGKDWLQRDIVNIADTEVVEVEVLHADGAQISAIKASADDTDFALQDIPEGREVLSAWSVNSMANALANLQLDSVAMAEDVDFSGATKFRLLTADGLEVLAEVAEVADPASAEGSTEDAPAATKTWLRLSAQSHEAAKPAADDAAEPATAGQESVDPGDSGQAADTGDSAEADSAETPVDATQRAEEINQRVSGWAYEIPSYKASALTKRMDDLLKALPEPE